LKLALKGKPDFIPVRLQLAKLLEAFGKKQDAIQQYKLLLKQNPDLAPAIGRLKELEASTIGKWNEATIPTHAEMNLQLLRRRAFIVTIFS